MHTTDMGHLTAGNCGKRTSNPVTLGCWHRQNVPMLSARVTGLYRQVLFMFLVGSIMGLSRTVQSAPAPRTSSEYFRRETTVGTLLQEAPTESFNHFNLDTLINSDLTYEYVTATEVVTEIMEEAQTIVPEIATSVPEIGLDLLTTSRSGKFEEFEQKDGEKKKTKSENGKSGLEISKHFLNSGCVLSSDKNNSPSSRVKRTIGCDSSRVKLVTLSGKFLKISNDGQTVRWSPFAEEGTFVKIINAHGLSLVRIKDPRTNRYIHMDGAGFLSMVQLSQQELASNVGPTVWRENPSDNDAFTYHQVVEGGSKWYLQLGRRAAVQSRAQSSMDVKFVKLFCD